jgi:hypothetical protein
MNKPVIYLDTTIISAYWYDGADVLCWGRRLMTREWWELERDGFDIFASRVTEEELAAGKYPRQRESIRMCRRIRYIQLTTEMYEFSEALLQSRVVPESKPGDAAQIAIATISKADYLLTWNYAHLANPIAQQKLVQLCGKSGFTPPMMVSPETIPRSTLGQQVKRRKDK